MTTIENDGRDSPNDRNQQAYEEYLGNSARAIEEHLLELVCGFAMRLRRLDGTPVRIDSAVLQGHHPETRLELWSTEMRGSVKSEHAFPLWHGTQLQPGRCPAETIERLADEIITEVAGRQPRDLWPPRQGCPDPLASMRRRAFENHVLQLARAHVGREYQQKHRSVIRDAALRGDYPDTWLSLLEFNVDRGEEHRHSFPIWSDDFVHDKAPMYTPERIVGDILMWVAGG